MKRTLAILAASAVCVATGQLFAQDTPAPSKAKDAINYSPYPGEDFPNQVFFGDTHLHTSYSADAGMIGNSLGPQ